MEESFRDFVLILFVNFVVGFLHCIEPWHFEFLIRNFLLFLVWNLALNSNSCEEVKFIGLTIGLVIAFNLLG